eukprot:12397281-Prorocentrum_lima.AAC.1
MTCSFRPGTCSQQMLCSVAGSGPAVQGVAVTDRQGRANMTCAGVHTRPAQSAGHMFYKFRRQWADWTQE